MTSRDGQGGFQNWQQLRDHAIEQFAETPHPSTEQEIIDAYQLHPEAIEKAIASVATDVRNGKARSGWGVLQKRAASIAAPPSNPTRSTSVEREKRIQRAEQWIRSAGAHLDRQTDLLLELFDERGLLHEYAQITLVENGKTEAGHPNYELSDPTGDLTLIDRMTHIWDEARPVGIRLEEEAIERAEKWKMQHALIRDRAPSRPLVGAYLEPADDDIPF